MMGPACHKRQAPVLNSRHGMSESRTSKTLKNIQVSLVYYFLQLILGFFSRKAFFDYLGSEVLGLNTTVSNLLGVLNLTELGIGISVSYFLYQPLYEKDKDRINEIITVQGWIYRRIACIILAGAFLLMCFFPWIFQGLSLPLWYVYATFGVMLFSSLLGYFVNYKQILLVADQKNYKVQRVTQGVTGVKTVIQIIGVSLLPYQFVFWLAMEVCGALLNSCILKMTLEREYPWLSPHIREGRACFKEYPEVMRKTRQVFVHKLASAVLLHTGPLIIYGFTSLTTVAIYGNYTLIVGRLTSLLGAVFSSSDAGVGTLVAGGDKAHILHVFWELLDSRLCLSTIFLICLYHLVDPFISIWLGEEYLLGPQFLLVFMAVNGILMIRSTVDTYINAYGLYHDAWAPLVEMILNIAFSILLGSLYGLEGVIGGIFISLFAVVCCWKPYFLFTKGIKADVRIYFRRLFTRLLNMAFLFGVMSVIVASMLPSKMVNFLEWGEYALLVFILSSFLSISTFCLFFQGMKDFVRRLRHFFVHKHL